jgi:hypothetical protein
MTTPRVAFGATPLGGGQHLRPGGAGSAVFLAGSPAVPQLLFCLSLS